MGDATKRFLRLIYRIQDALGKRRSLTNALSCVYSAYPETVAPSVAGLRRSYRSEEPVTPDMIIAANYALQNVLKGNREYYPLSAEDLGLGANKKDQSPRRRRKSHHPKRSKDEMTMLNQYAVPKGMVPGYAAKAFTDVILKQQTKGKVNEYAVAALEQRLLGIRRFKKGMLSLIHNGADYCPRHLYYAIVRYWQENVEDFRDAPKELNTKELTRRMSPKTFDEKAAYQPGDIVHKDSQFAVVLGTYNDCMVLAGKDGQQFTRQ